jgi:hypothetical protein
MARLMKRMSCKRSRLGLVLKEGRIMEEDTRHKIEIAVDSEYSQEFVDWLNTKGHIAHVGRTTENYMNAVCTADDSHVNEILRHLWEEFRMADIDVS